MRSLSALVVRHMKVFFRDATNFIFCALSCGVILGLYFLFIRTFMLDAVREFGLSGYLIEQFVDCLMLSGLLLVIQTTSCMGVATQLVKDRHHGMLEDFLSAPVSQSQVWLSYPLAAFFLALMFTGITLLAILSFLRFQYELVFSLTILMNLSFMLILCCLISALLVCLLAFAAGSEASFSTLGSLFGTILGFINGVYIPIGYYPAAIQSGLFLFPLATATSLVRQVLCEDLLISLCANAPSAVETTLRQTFGLAPQFFDHFLHANQQVFYLVASCGLFAMLYLFIALRFSKKE